MKKKIEPLEKNSFKWTNNILIKTILSRIRRHICIYRRFLLNMAKMILNRKFAYRLKNDLENSDLKKKKHWRKNLAIIWPKIRYSRKGVYRLIWDDKRNRSTDRRIEVIRNKISCNVHEFYMRNWVNFLVD